MNTSYFLNNQDCFKHQACSNVPSANTAYRPNRSDSPSQDGYSSVKPRLVSTHVEAETSLRKLAQHKMSQGDYSEAIAIITGLLDRHPDNANDYNNRGFIYYQSGELDAALADYNKAIQLNPDLAAAYNNRANYYAAKKQLTKAIADYDRAIDLNPLHVRALINRGITFRDLKLYDRALENFDFALRLGQLQGHAWTERGRTHHLRGDWNYALADYRRALPFFREGRQRQQIQAWIDELLSPFQF
ncbi:MAG TPA: tetratricopeptide repeat protein [Phormidium sp.]